MAILPIDGPISVHDVANTLGHPVSYDVGTLCRHPNINKWARYKPVRHSKLFDLTESDLEAANYGLKISPSGYEYLKPIGGATYPYRLGDFRGYAHNSRPQYYVEDKVYRVNLFQSLNTDIPISYSGAPDRIPFDKLIVDGTSLKLSQMRVQMDIVSQLGVESRYISSDNLSDVTNISHSVGLLPYNMYKGKLYLTYQSGSNWPVLPWPKNHLTIDEFDIEIYYEDHYSIQIQAMEVKMGSVWYNSPINGRLVLPSPATVNGTRVTIKYTANTAHTQNMTYLNLRHASNPLFNAPAVSDAGLTIIDQSSGVTGTFPYLDFAENSTATIAIENTISPLNEGGAQYADDYSVLFSVCTQQDERASRSSIWNNGV